MTTQASDCCRRAHCQQLTFPKISGTAEILCPGRTSLSAASMAVWVAASRSAARPVTGASGSGWTNRLVAWVAIQPSMCAPRSLRNVTRQVFGEPHSSAGWRAPQTGRHEGKQSSTSVVLVALGRVSMGRHSVESSAHLYEIAVCELCAVVHWRREVAHDTAPQPRPAQQK